MTAFKEYDGHYSQGVEEEEDKVLLSHVKATCLTNQATDFELQIH